MSQDVNTTRLNKRSSAAVLTVIAVAVAMLVVLVAQTSRQAKEAGIINTMGRQRMLSERLVSSVLASREASPSEQPLWRARVATTSGEFRESALQLEGVHEGGPTLEGGSGSVLSEFHMLAPLRDSLIATARAGGETTLAADRVNELFAQQRRFVGSMEHLMSELEGTSTREVDFLVQLEALCVALLLGALGFAVRLALQPTQAHLISTVEALEESESRTRAMLDAMDEGMLLMDRSGKVLNWNPSLIRMLGIREDAQEVGIAEMAAELRDENGDLLGPERLPTRTTIRTGKALKDVVLQATRSDGSVVWLSCNTHPLFRGAGEEPHAAVGINRDITQERLLESQRVAQSQALEEQNRELADQTTALESGQSLYRSVVDTVGTAIVGLDPMGKVFEWNREAEALFGIPRADALGEDYAERFVTDSYRTRMREGIRNVLGGASVRSFVAPVRDGAGLRRSVLWNITPLRTDENSPAYGIIAAGLDITERESSDERFRVLFERATDAHVLYDETGILDCNDATLRMLDVPTRDAILGQSLATMSPERQPDGRLSTVVASQMRHRALDLGYQRFEWVHRTFTGRDFPVDVTLTPVRLNGREVLLAVWHDIAHRKAVEDALREAKDAAESANRTKSEFMTRMNHELRTPLTAIIGFSRVLLQGRNGALSDAAKLYAERIRENGMHLLSLINQILDVAKVEAGRMELELEPVQLDALVNETVSMLESTAEAKGLSMRRELPVVVVPYLTDAGKLRQILINLVGNAIKFTAKGGVTVRLVTDSSGVPTEIMVRDTGMGIAPEMREKIFEPFEQGESSTRRQFGGTGLGLSIVRAFTEHIGATILVDGTPGAGTTFTIKLPPPGQLVAARQDTGDADAAVS